MKSTFLPTGMGYVYALSDEVDEAFLTIEVSQLRSRGGSPLALLSTSSTIDTARRIPGSDRVLNAEVWLLSDSSRMSYANALTRLIPAPAGASSIDFSAVLEEVAQRVIDAENSPVGVVRLDPQAKIKPTLWLVENIIPMGKPTILYGAGGVGKSILASALAVSVQMGVPWMGRKVRQSEVLYLDWETDETDIAGRVQAVAGGLRVLQDDPSIRYASLVKPIEDRVTQLARYVAEEKIGLVIIDSVGMAMSSARDGTDASETAIRFFRALRGLNTSVLALDHVAGADMKAASKGAAKPYGSVYKWNSARNAFELRENREPDSKGAHLVLKHRKSNIGPRSPDLYMTMDWQPTGVTFASERVVIGQVTPLPERIMDLLSVAPATPHQMSDLLSEGDVYFGEMEVRNVLKGLIGDGKVTVMADGTVRKVEETKPSP